MAVYTSRAGTGVKYTNHVLWLCTHLELGQELSTLTMCVVAVYTSRAGTGVEVH